MKINQDNIFIKVPKMYKDSKPNPSIAINHWLSFGIR